ncbi:MAG: single-stranded-DNA-specific exonuclease RecJ, partial [Lachnospiraceae bacterium]|nr:single-stranded-DNA-specific exonuclease RecJ [Lachnospiraceae bacterium]
MEKFVISKKSSDVERIAEKFAIDLIVAELIQHRGISEDEEIKKYLYGSISDLYSPELMKGMTRAGEILFRKIDEKKRIRIIGDYDVDGIISSYILQTGLRRLGAICDVKIPDRITDGYGINERLVRQAHLDGIDTIVTCDNGITAFDQIKTLKELGISTVITDHHDIQYCEKEDGSREYILPPADAVIDPKQPGCTYPFKGLCGAGVAWKLICYLYDQAGIPKYEKNNFIEFVCIATISDVMDLKDENRILVKEGLKRIRKIRNIGLQELIYQNGIDIHQIDADHIGFTLGPCINASGRMDSAEIAMSLLETNSREEAKLLSAKIRELNEKRKEMTAKGFEEAVQLVESTDIKNDKVLVVQLSDCHESIIGIIAGKLKEHYNKPSFVLTKSGKLSKGSGRSIEKYQMYDELYKCREYLTRFGGH